MADVDSLAIVGVLLVLLLVAAHFISSNNNGPPHEELTASKIPDVAATPGRSQTATSSIPASGPIPTPTKTAAAGFAGMGTGDVERLNDASKYHTLLWPNVSARWASMPVRVFINTTKEKYIADYMRAAETWENGTEGLASFVLVNSSDEADVTFVWIEPVLSDEALSRLGWTNPSAVNAGGFYIMRRATITMRVGADPCDADTSIINVVAHELGHALGLGHETRYNYDLMKEQLKCQFYELPVISEKAMKALAELYRIPKIESG